MGTELSTCEQAKVLYGEGRIGYIAGIVDGEGTIGAYVYSSKRYCDGQVLVVQFRITNKNIDVLNCCQMVLGGSIHPLKARSNVNDAQCYYLQIYNKPNIKRALLIVLDYLIVKYEVAKLMLELIDSVEGHYHGSTPRELEIVTEMRALNKKGRELTEV